MRSICLKAILLLLVLFIGSARAEIPILSMVELESQIKSAQRREDWTSLISLTELYIQKYNDCAEARYNLGNYYSNLKNYKLALDAYTEAQKKTETERPFFESAKRRSFLRSLYFNRANVTARLGHYTEALELYSKAINLKPDEISSDFAQEIMRNYGIVAKARDAAAAKLKSIAQEGSHRRAVDLIRTELETTGLAPEELIADTDSTAEEWKRDDVSQGQTTPEKEDAGIGSPATEAEISIESAGSLANYYQLQARLGQLNAKIREQELLRRIRARQLSSEQQKLLDMISGWSGNTRRFKEIGEGSLEARELGIPDWRTHMGAGDDSWNKKIVDWNAIPTDDSLFPYDFKDVYRPDTYSWSGSQESFGHASEVSEPNDASKDSRIRYTFIGKFVDRKDRRPFPLVNRDGFIIDPDSFRFEGRVQNYAVYQGDLGTTMLFVKGQSLAGTRFSYSLVESPGTYQKEPTATDTKSNIDKILPQLQAALDEFIDKDDSVDDKALLLEGFMLSEGNYIGFGAHIDAFIQNSKSAGERFHNLTRILLQLPGRPVGVDGMSCDFWAETYVRLARYLGIPTRYVGGYWNTDANLDLTRGELHAWARYYSDRAEAWIEVNPTPGSGSIRDNDLRVQRFKIWKELKRLQKKLGKLARGSRSRAQRAFDFWAEKEKLLAEEAKTQESLERRGRQASRLKLKAQPHADEVKLIKSFHTDLESRLETLYQISLRPRFDPKLDPIFARLEMEYVAATLEMIVRFAPVDEKGRIKSITQWIGQNLTPDGDGYAFYHALAVNDDYQVIFAQKKLYLRAKKSFIWRDLKIDLQNYDSYLTRLTDDGKVTVLAFNANASDILRPGQPPKAIQVEGGALKRNELYSFHLYNPKNEYAISYSTGKPARHFTRLENGRLLEDLCFRAVHTYAKSKLRLIEALKNLTPERPETNYEVYYWLDEDLLSNPEGGLFIRSSAHYRSKNYFGNYGVDPVFLDANNFILTHVDPNKGQHYSLNGKEEIFKDVASISWVKAKNNEGILKVYAKSENVYNSRPSFYKFSDGKFVDVTSTWFKDWTYSYRTGFDTWALLKGLSPYTYANGRAVEGKRTPNAAPPYFYYNGYWAKQGLPGGVYRVDEQKNSLAPLNFEVNGHAVPSSAYMVHDLEVNSTTGHYIAAVSDRTYERGYFFRNAKLDTTNLPQLFLTPLALQDEGMTDDIGFSSTTDLSFSLVSVVAYPRDASVRRRYFLNEHPLTSYTPESIRNYESFSAFAMRRDELYFVLSPQSDYEGRWTELKKFMVENDQEIYIAKVKALMQSDKVEASDLAYILRTAFYSELFSDSREQNSFHLELSSFLARHLLRIPTLPIPTDERIRFIDFALSLGDVAAYSEKDLDALAQVLHQKTLSTDAELYLQERLRAFRGLAPTSKDEGSYPSLIWRLYVALRNVNGRPVKDY